MPNQVDDAVGLLCERLENWATQFDLTNGDLAYDIRLAARLLKEQPAGDGPDIIPRQMSPEEAAIGKRCEQVNHERVPAGDDAELIEELRSWGDGSRGDALSATYVGGLITRAADRLEASSSLSIPSEVTEAMCKAGAEVLWRLSDTEGDGPAFERVARDIYTAMLSSASGER